MLRHHLFCNTHASASGLLVLWRANTYFCVDFAIKGAERILDPAFVPLTCLLVLPAQQTRKRALARSSIMAKLALGLRNDLLPAASASKRILRAASAAVSSECFSLPSPPFQLQFCFRMSTMFPDVSRCSSNSKPNRNQVKPKLLLPGPYRLLP